MTAIETRCCRWLFTLTLLLSIGSTYSVNSFRDDDHVRFPFYEANYDVVPAEWVQTSPSDRRLSSVELFILLPPRNIEELERLLVDVSDPDSPRYGQHLSSEELQKLVAPPKQKLQLVLAWLEEYGVEDIRIGQQRDLVAIRVSVAKASDLLRTSFLEYSHTDDCNKRVVLSVSPYYIPRAIWNAEAVEQIVGVHGFPTFPLPVFDYNDHPATAVHPNPTVIRAQYQIPQHLLANCTSTRQAVAEFQDCWFSPQDLQLFFKRFVPSSQVALLLIAVLYNAETQCVVCGLLINGSLIQASF